jgi:hypothetical protein
MTAIASGVCALTKKTHMLRADESVVVGVSVRNVLPATNELGLGDDAIPRNTRTVGRGG